jgi:hypothetical protein
MQISELNLVPEKREKLIKAMQRKGYLNGSPWQHPPSFVVAPNDSEYEFIVEVIRWNTSSSKLVKMGCRFDQKKNDYIISYYKQGTTKRHSNFA